jgi:hypothetical protein
LRKDLQRVMTTAKGMTPNEMHRSLNATAKVLHAFCKTYAGTLDVRPLAVGFHFVAIFSWPRKLHIGFHVSQICTLGVASSDIKPGALYSRPGPL